jgi:hypothetical protein
MALDVMIVARLRPATPEVAAVRWSVDTRVGFPVDGFDLVRRHAGLVTPLVVNMRLPGATGGPAGDLISQKQLKADLAARTTAHGMPLPDSGAVFAMLPMLLFALEQPDGNELQAKLTAVAAIFLNSHERDPELARRFWSRRPTPNMPQIEAMRNSTIADDASLYDSVISHYRMQAVGRLLFLAMDFGTAKLLGLGIDDLLPGPVQPGQLSYDLVARFNSGPRQAQGYATDSDPNRPPAPGRPTCTAGRTVVGYPAFEPFYGCRLPKWRATAPPVPGRLFSDLVSLTEKGPRRYDSPLAELHWAAPSEREGEGDVAPLVPRAAVFWRVERSAFGPALALSDLQPVVSGATPFSLCHDGQAVARTTDSQFRDDVDIPWGEAPMEGWYAYRVSGIDVFGVIGPPSPPGIIRLRDTFAPSPPAIALDREKIEIGAIGSVSETINLGWTAENEFKAPDADKFRIFQDWTPIVSTPLEVVECKEIAAPHVDLNILEVDVVLADDRGKPLTPAKVDALAGATLRALNADFLILAAAPDPSSVRVRRSAGRAPTLGGACAVSAGSSKSGKMNPVMRSKVSSGNVVIDSVIPFELHILDSHTGLGVAPAKGELYLHLLLHSFAVSPTADGARLAISSPDPNVDRRGAELFAAFQKLPAAQAIAFLGNSPALFLPPHDISLTLAPPQADFIAGAVRLSVTAADSAAYQTGPHGVGNEGSSNTILLPVRVTTKPALPGFRPEELWAHDAASFDPRAKATMRWPTILLATSYQIERALEPALGQAPSLSDDQLLVMRRRSLRITPSSV